MYTATKVMSCRRTDLRRSVLAVAVLSIALGSLFLGEGIARASTPRAFVVAGSGDRTKSGDGGLATDAGGSFFAVAALPGGGFLASEPNSGVVRRVDAGGVIKTVAGNGAFGFQAPLGDGGPATSANLNPEGLAVLPGGGFLIADTGDNRVRRVGPDGIITTVAGTGPALDGLSGFVESGDGGPATAATLNRPVAVALLPGGGFLIADELGNRVRRVSRQGIITTVAGTGAAQESGDGGPATSAGLFAPNALAALPGGGFLVADRYGRSVRRVDSHGKITTVVGGRKPGACYSSSGDGGPAARASLWEPDGLALMPHNGFLVADGGLGRVRMVDGHGVISAIAGGPQCMRSGHVVFALSTSRLPWSGLTDDLGASAMAARMDAAGLALRADGSLLVSGGTHVLAITTGAHPPLAVALRPPRVRGGSIKLRLATSMPGRLRLQVRAPRSEGSVAEIARSVPAGVSEVGLPHVPAGPFVVRVTLSGKGRRASDETVVVAGRTLSTSLARAAIARRCCEGGPAVQVGGSLKASRSPAALSAGVPLAASPPVARPAQEEEGPTREEVLACQRFGRARVDCGWGSRGVCTAVTSATLREALVYLAEYKRCSKPPYFRAHPQLGPALVAALL